MRHLAQKRCLEVRANETSSHRASSVENKDALFDRIFPNPPFTHWYWVKQSILHNHLDLTALDPYGDQNWTPIHTLTSTPS